MNKYIKENLFYNIRERPCICLYNKICNLTYCLVIPDKIYIVNSNKKLYIILDDQYKDENYAIAHNEINPALLVTRESFVNFNMRLVNVNIDITTIKEHLLNFSHKRAFLFNKQSTQNNKNHDMRHYNLYAILNKMLKLGIINFE